MAHRARTDEAVLHHSRLARPDGAARPRVTLIENFASHAAVQELVDVKPDRTSPEIL